MTAYKQGDKVRCISKDHGWERNNKLIEIGEVYTIASISPSNRITLEEINKIDPDGLFYIIKDFEILGNPFEDYDRAMGII